IHQPGNVAGGTLAIYLLLTGWMTVRRPAGPPSETRARVIRAAGFLVVLAAAVAIAPQALGVSAAFLALAAACGLAVLSDRRVANAGGLVGPARLRRHLWR